MLRLSLFKKKEEILFALDIGTEAVKSLVFKRQNGKTTVFGADIEDYYSQGIEYGWSFDKEIIKKVVSESIEEAKKQADIKKRCDIAFWKLPGNILEEKTILNTFKRKNPEKIINQSEEKEIHEAIIAEARRKVSETIFKRSGIAPKDLRLLSFNILETKVDGYEVNQLKGFTGQQLNFRTLFIFLPDNYFEIIRKIGKELKLGSPKLISESESLIAAFSKRKTTAIFLDIGGKITQVFLMKEGKITALDYFKSGGEIFSKRISQILGITKAQTEYLKVKYTRRTLSEEARKRMKEILAPSYSLWFNDLKNSLKNISEEEENIFPSEILIFGGGSLLPEMEEILSGGDWEDLPFMSSPQAKFVSLKDLENIKDKTGIVSTPQFIPVLLTCYTNA